MRMFNYSDHGDVFFHHIFDDVLSSAILPLSSTHGQRRKQGRTYGLRWQVIGIDRVETQRRRDGARVMRMVPMPRGRRYAKPHRITRARVAS